MKGSTYWFFDPILHELAWSIFGSSSYHIHPCLVHSEFYSDKNPPEHWREGGKKKNKEYVDRERIYLLLGRECEHGVFFTKLKKKERTFRDGERAKATCKKDILVVAIAWVKIVLHKRFVI